MGKQKPRKPPLLSKDRKDPEPPHPTKRQFFDEMAEQSDLGCVLVAAHSLDGALQELLAAKFVSESALADQDMKYLFRYPAGTISDFSSKANVAYALGLITADAWEAINWIRVLRNALAHPKSTMLLTDKRVSKIVACFGQFADGDVRYDYCIEVANVLVKVNRGKQLRFGMERRQFMVAAGCLFLEIEAKTNELRNRDG